MTELTELSDRLHADPYANSQRLRHRFRQEKKIENALLQQDAALKQKYGLGERIKLERLDPALHDKEKEMWGRITDGKPSALFTSASVPRLAKIVKTNTIRRYDPFDDKDGVSSAGFLRVGIQGSNLGVRAREKGKAKMTTEEKSQPQQHRTKRSRHSLRGVPEGDIDQPGEIDIDENRKAPRQSSPLSSLGSHHRL